MAAAPPLTLYYSPKACSLASHIVLLETGLAHQAVAVDIRAGANRAAGYLAINPQGTVPALAVDAEVLTESPAILNYLADLAPHAGLLPEPGSFARARALQWMSLLSGTLHAAFRAVFRPQAYATDEAAMQAVRSQGHARLAQTVARIERDLPAARAQIGAAFSCLDAYLFVFYLWSFDERLAAPLPERGHWRALAREVYARDSTREAIRREHAVRAYPLAPELG